jgi:uncharacterized membrane protein YhaH (DUF805 family)
VGYRFNHVALNSSEFKEFKKAMADSGIDHYIEHDASGSGYEVFVDKADEIRVNQLVAAYLPDNPNFTAPPMNLTRAIRDGFTKWTFKGRASRSEYWFFLLVACGVSFVSIMTVILVTVFQPPSISDKNVNVLMYLVGGVNLFLVAAVLKVAVRRMHDRNVSGLKLMLRCLPIIAYGGFTAAPPSWFVERTGWETDGVTWSADVLHLRPVLAVGKLADGTISTAVSEISNGSEVLPGVDGFTYLVGPVAANGLIYENNAAANIQGSNWSVVVQLRGGAAGEDIWNELTSRCFSRDATCPTAQVAIVLDGEVISAPVVQEAVFTGGEVQITGDFTEQEARDLTKMLNYGSSAASDRWELSAILSRELVLTVLALMSLTFTVWNIVDASLPGRPARNRYDRV